MRSQFRLRTLKKNWLTEEEDRFIIGYEESIASQIADDNHHLLYEKLVVISRGEIGLSGCYHTVRRIRQPHRIGAGDANDTPPWPAPPLNYDTSSGY